MNSRERVRLALSHQEADRVPLDLGSGAVTGMNVNVVYGLRQALGLDAPGTPVKVVEPYQMLGEIKPDLAEALGVDVVGLHGPRTMFGFRNEGWKAWRTFDGTPVLVPAGFNTDPEPNGDILMYPEGDNSGSHYRTEKMFESPSQAKCDLAKRLALWYAAEVCNKTSRGTPRATTSNAIMPSSGRCYNSTRKPRPDTCCNR
jgi:hypothetical protein